MKFNRHSLSILLVLLCVFSLVSSAFYVRGTEATKCRPKDRKSQACLMIYQPVCGYKPHIRCVKAPCNYITYSNSCTACLDPDVRAYTPGPCAEDKKVSS